MAETTTEYRVVYLTLDNTVMVYDSGTWLTAERGLREFRQWNRENRFTGGPFGDSWIEKRIVTYNDWEAV